MSSKINVYVDLRDSSLKEGLVAKLAGDWTTSWSVLEAARNPALALTASVAVIDNEQSLPLFGQSTTIVFAGVPSEPAKYFQAIDTGCEDSVEAICKAVKRAFAYRETTLQNIESLYPAVGDAAPLELMAHSLSARLREQQQLSDMRLSLIEQLPVGILGVDDEGIVALANPKAIEMLGMEDIPIWGMSVDAVFKGQVEGFVKDPSAEELKICVYDQQILLRKSPFLLEKKPVGTILTLLRP